MPKFRVKIRRLSEGDILVEARDLAAVNTITTPAVGRVALAGLGLPQTIEAGTLVDNYHDADIVSALTILSVTPEPNNGGG